MSKFRMNWHDFKNNRFQYNGIVYNLTNRKYIDKVMSKTRTLFLLNIYRERWVSVNSLIDFIYDEIPLDVWPEYQLDTVAKDIMRIRAMLPKDIKITNSWSFGYKLETGQPED